MSGYFGLVRSIALVVLILFVGLATERAEDNNNIRGTVREAGRTLASVSAFNHKELDLAERSARASGAYALRHTVKSLPPLRSEIEVVSQSDDILVLRAVIKSTVQLDNVEFKWTVPGGLEHVNGSIEGEIPAITANQNYPLEVTLRKASQDNVQVHFTISTSEGETRYAHVAQYNSETQAKINERNAGLLEAAKQLPREKPKDLKVFH